MNQQALTTERQAHSNRPVYHIYVPSPWAFLVTIDHKVVSNWRELEAEAREACEPATRERWIAHWQRTAQIASQAQQTEKLEDLMYILLPPDMYYPCPPELAAKAVCETKKISRF